MSYSGFYTQKNPSTPGGFEPANLGSSGEYDYHGTTDVDLFYKFKSRYDLVDKTTTNKTEIKKCVFKTARPKVAIMFDSK